MIKISARRVSDYTDDEDDEEEEKKKVNTLPQSKKELRQREFGNPTGITTLPDGIYWRCYSCDTFHSAEEMMDEHMVSWEIPKDNDEKRIDL